MAVRDVAILVATHKAAPMPVERPYIPIQVGSALTPARLGYQTDDVGKNISALNATFCELTATYWARHNLRANAYGLVHYRRFLTTTRTTSLRQPQLLTHAQAVSAMERYDVVLPKPRRYYLETVESQYRHAHSSSSLLHTREALVDSPLYLSAFDRVMRRRHLYAFNMLLMRRDSFFRYCDWVFPLLFDVRDRITHGGTLSEPRLLGYLGERLLNVWVEMHREQLNVLQLPVLHLHGDPKVRKGVNMIRRKFSSRTRAST